MDRFILIGGATLQGDVRIAGAKNAVLPILAATLLAKSPMSVHNVPHLDDVHTMTRILSALGLSVKADWEAASIAITPTLDAHGDANLDLLKTMRASILVLGPLLARLGYAKVALPGGCAIGVRPIDLHLKALERLGAKVEFIPDGIAVSAPERLRGAHIRFDSITVTGTENVLMVAVLADGTTVIENAACEPEVSDLAHCLNAMGARIRGIGTHTLVIEGVRALDGVKYTVIPDRIEAGTYLTGAVMTSGCVKAINVNPSDLEVCLAVLKSAGACVTVGDDWVQVDMRHGKPQAVSVDTAPFPGFPTDMQAQLMAMNAIATGFSTIRETIFENRFMHVEELVRMGANISVQGSQANISGVESLQGTEVFATDLRASACLVLAGLCAAGETVINRIHHIDRGYEHIENKLAGLGVKMARVPMEAANLAQVS